MSAKYLSVYAPTHPMASRGGYAYIHRAVLFDTIGPGEHACNWCGRPLSWDGVGPERLCADHLDFVKRNNDPANLVPSCLSCNSKRSNPNKPKRQPRFPYQEEGYLSTQQVADLIGITASGVRLLHARGRMPTAERRRWVGGGGDLLVWRTDAITAWAPTRAKRGRPQEWIRVRINPEES